MYKVTFYTLTGGKSPARDFMFESEPRVQRKIFNQIKFLEEFGLTSQNRNLRKLTGTPLWESRILGGDSIRIISVAIVEKTVVILHIFKKKSDKTPVKDLRTSLERYKDLTKYI